jgi:hypothetical protein
MSFSRHIDAVLFKILFAECNLTLMFGLQIFVRIINPLICVLGYYFCRVFGCISRHLDVSTLQGSELHLDESTLQVLSFYCRL